MCSNRSRRSRTPATNVESRLDRSSSLPRPLADNQLAITSPGLCVRKGVFEYLERSRRGDSDREGLARLPVDHLHGERIATTIPQQAHVDTARRARREFNQSVHLLTLGAPPASFAPPLASFDPDPPPAFRQASTIVAVSEFLHTMYRITDPERSRAFYEALGMEFRRDLDIVRNGELEATNYFFGFPGQDEELELTFNHDGRTYELGTGYGHVAIGVDNLERTLAQLKTQGIEPEREPYSVREGGSLICFFRDPDGYRIELIESGG